MLKNAFVSISLALGLCFALLLSGCSTANSSAGTPIQTPVSITSATLTAGRVGRAYSASVAVSGGTAPYTFSFVSGVLPGGLVFSPNGSIAGTPTGSGAFSFTVAVVDNASQRATATLSLTVAAAPTTLTISTSSLANASVGVLYNAPVTATGGTTPYTFTVASGTLPAGLALSSTGAITGTPTAAGTSNFTVAVTDADSQRATVPLSVTVTPAVSISTTTLPGGSVNTDYVGAVAAVNGTAPYTFAVTTGSLPAGLTLASNGAISGKPTATSPSTFTVTVTDANGKTDSKQFTITVAAAPVFLTINTKDLGGTVVSSTYAAQLSISGGTGAYTVTQTGGTLPAGLTLSSTGALTGTPATTGAYSFTVSVVDNGSPQGTGSGTVTLNVVDSTVAVDAGNKLLTVPATFYGLHTSVYDSKMSDVSAVTPYLANAGISVLRYPGGGYSDVYHWINHTTTPYHASENYLCGTLPNDYIVGNARFANFVQLLEAAKAQAVITVNYGTSVANSTATVSNGVGYDGSGNNFCSQPNTYGQPQEAAAWVAYANGSTTDTHLIGVDAAGYDWKTTGYWAALRSSSPLSSDDGLNALRINHPAAIGIKFWEIGNEVYYNGWNQNLNPETDLHAPYVYPNGYGNSFNSRESNPALSGTSYGSYSKQFIAAMKAVDPTILIGVSFASKGATDPILPAWNTDLARSVCSGGAFDLAIIHYYPGTYTDVKPSELLTLPQYDLPIQVADIKNTLSTYCSNAANIQFMLTETSPNDKLTNGFPQNVMGVFVLNNLMSALKQGIQNLDWLELHSTSTVDPYNGFLSNSETPGAPYYGFGLAYLAAAPGDFAVPASVTAPATGNTIVPYGSLKKDGRKGIVLINNDATKTKWVQVTVSNATLGTTGTQYSFGVNAPGSGTTLTGTPVTINGNSFAVQVPAYTAVELLVP